jgi:hypothetical protein
MESEQKSYAHHFIPKWKNNRLVIVHHGHAPSFDGKSPRRRAEHG